jgi:hypothetical protein
VETELYITLDIALEDFRRACEAASSALARAGGAMSRMGGAMQDFARVREQLELLAQGTVVQPQALLNGGELVPLPSGLLVPPAVAGGQTFLGCPVTWTSAPLPEAPGLSPLTLDLRSFLGAYYDRDKPGWEAAHNLQAEFVDWRERLGLNPTTEQLERLRRMHAIAGETVGQLHGVSQVPIV